MVVAVDFVVMDGNTIASTVCVNCKLFIVWMKERTRTRTHSEFVLSTAVDF